MFCPGCAIEITDDLKFCRRCGANLRGVQDAMVSAGTQDRFDWSKTWVADMFRTPEEKERRRFLTLEERQLHEERNRINEIKGGIITAMSGVGLMLFLYFFMGSVASQNRPENAEILRHVWLVGIIPILVGIGILISGLFVNPRFLKSAETLMRRPLPPDVTPSSLADKSTAQMAHEPAPQSNYSVAEDTTANFPGRDTGQ